MTDLPPLTDAQLMADLDDIAAKAQARKKAGESYAHWKMTQQLEAIHRFHLRAGYPETATDLPRSAPG
jgi:hypothetical protein